MPLQGWELLEFGVTESRYRGPAFPIASRQLITVRCAARNHDTGAVRVWERSVNVPEVKPRRHCLY